MKEYRAYLPINGKKMFIPGEHDAVAAIIVSRWTRSVDTMLPKSPSEVMEMFKKKNSVLIKNEDNVLVGHAAATATYPDGSIEIGSIFTNDKYRNSGVGTLATQAVVKIQNDRNPGTTLFALGNERSGKMFSKMGSPVMELSKLHPEVFEACKDCPRKPKEIDMCCDTPYELTNVVKGVIPALGCLR